MVASQPDTVIIPVMALRRVIWSPGSIQDGRIAFDIVDIFRNVDRLIQFTLCLAQFDAEDAGHDFRRAARIGPVIGIFA